MGTDALTRTKTCNNIYASEMRPWVRPDRDFDCNIMDDLETDKAHDEPTRSIDLSTYRRVELLLFLPSREG